MKLRMMIAAACCVMAAVGADYTAFRKEMRAFYTDREQSGAVKDPRSKAAYDAIERELTDWCKANPQYDALDLRRESYKAMERHFVPFLFKESPFYFEAGINGGWGGYRPALIVEKMCNKFFREKGLIPGEAFARLGARNRECLTLCCGPFCDKVHHVPPMRTILKKGFKGVRDEVAAAIKTCPKDDTKGLKELETALAGLDTLHVLQLRFADAAKAQLAQAKDLTPAQKKNFERIAESAVRCPWESPRNLYEGLNTLWFVREMLGYVDGTYCYSLGRPDAYFIDFYKKEIAAGTITKEEAREFVTKFLMTADCHYDSYSLVDSYCDHEMEIPMSLGGCDVNGVPLYNELTEMFLDAHLDADCVYPKLHCRIGSNSPEAYFRKIGDMLMKGHAVFSLFNDDRYVKQFLREGFSPEDARSYIGNGCWDGYIDSVQDGDAANYLSMIKLLEMTINRDEKKMKACELTLDPIDDAKNFEELRDIYWRNFSRFLESVTDDYTKYGAKGVNVFPHPIYSMCIKGGIESRRDTTEGGAGHRPRMMTLGFIGNVADSLMAIKSVCFDRKLATVKEFLDAVRGNWQGKRGEELRLAALSSPYWGDGTQEPVDIMGWMMTKAEEQTRNKDNGYGDKFRYGVFTYREFMYWGYNTKATPDGRRNGDRLAQGFTPSEYRCEEGATTVMNCIGKLPHDSLYQSNVNVTFDASAMNPEILASILRVFCEKDSHLIQPNCNSVELLLEAQKNPELHRNLIIRVCGFSARFTSLSKRWQDEVIARHRLK